MTLSLPVEADGSFRKEALNRGRYSLHVSGAPGFPAKDVDLTDGDMEGVILGPSLTPPHPNQLELR